MELEKFFADAEARHNEKVQTEKKKTLISAGLYTEERNYSKTRAWGNSFYDRERKEYYTITKVPLDVTDKEYAKIKQILAEREEEAQKVKIEEDVDPILRHAYDTTPNAERILGSLITLSLILWLALAIALLVTTLLLYKKLSYGSDTLVLLLGVFLSANVAIIGIVTWAYRRVIINISNNLHNIWEKLK